MSCFRLLTVGDGDLSFSLALKRAYPQISVSASTLVETSTELCRTYANAAETSKELQDTTCQILYSANATKLEDTIRCNGEEEKFDIIVFNHPHLGDATLLQSEQKHAENHYSLLSHYFHSAKKLIKKNGGRIHVCLCGNQPKSWNVITAAEVNNLRCICQESTAYPIDKWLFREDCISYELAQVQSHYPVSRKFRNGSLGSKHFLARYGYRHQRTEGDLHDGSVKHINVEQSINFVFEVYESDAITDKKVERKGYVCSICKQEFQTSDQLSNHLDTPGLPDIVTGAHKRKKKSSSNTEKNELNKPVLNKDNEKQSAMPEPISIDDTNAPIIIEATVSSKFNSKRIKWLCRQDDFPLSKFIKSKSQCENAIRKGRVFVNRQVAFDSSRIVFENDVVSLVEEYGSSEDAHKTTNDSEHSSQVRFIKRILSREITVEVVYKPVGVRCAGNFSKGTLEMITKMHPISKIDTGCAGLCVLVQSPSKIDTTALNSLKVLYTFTALVHGHPPEEWERGVYTRVPTEGLRQWKRRKTNQQEECQYDTITTPLDLDKSLFIKCQDTLQVDGQQLSTLTVQSRFDDGRLGNVISFVCRKLGYPVVNDRFGKKEYSALPRRMKNIVKQKVCIGCYDLDIEYEGESTIVKIDPHKRTLCSFWRNELI